MNIYNYGLEGKYFNLDLQNVSEEVGINRAVVYNEGLNLIESMVKEYMPDTMGVKEPTTDSAATEMVELVPRALKCATDGSAEITLGQATYSSQKGRLQQLYAKKPQGRMLFEDGKLLFRPTQKGKGSGSSQVLPRIDALGWKISKTKKETKFSISFPNDISYEEMKQGFADRVEELNLSLEPINHAYMHASDKADAINRLDELLMQKRSELQKIMKLRECSNA